MPIVPTDLLSQAENLLEQARTLPDIPIREALLRTAVSRAYYAVLHTALLRARREGYVRPPAEYGSHEGLWNWWFVEQRPIPLLADGGDHLKGERVRADYRLRETFSLVGTSETIEEARATFDLARKD